MKIEIKNLKIAKFASEETLCFQCSIIIDGKNAGTASNDGHGACNRYHFKDRETEKRFMEYCESLPPVQFDGGSLPSDADLVIGGLIDKIESEREFKRWCRKKTVFRIKGDKAGEWRAVNIEYGAKAVDWIRKKHGDTVEEILNERFSPKATQP